MRLLSSQLNSPGPLVMARSAPGPAPEQRAAQIPVMWPRHINGRTVMAPISPAQIPPGWQSIQVHVPQRMATCEETDCPQFLNGWSEIRPQGGGAVSKQGLIGADEAAQVWGTRSGIGPQVIHHPPGTPCQRIHKVPSGIPPLYTVNGRPTLWNEFEDALGGGANRMAQISREGRY